MEITIDWKNVIHFIFNFPREHVYIPEQSEGIFKLSREVRKNSFLTISWNEGSYGLNFASYIRGFVITNLHF